MPKRLNRKAGALVAVAALAACALVLSCSSEARTNPCPDGTEPYTEYRLFFGRGDGNNPRAFSDEDWREFLEGPVTSEFPAGLTVLDARGQYTEPSGNLIREYTKVLIILVPPDSGSAPKIDAIIEEYKRRSAREAVLRQVTDTCASF